MEYMKAGNTYMVRLDPGDEILESLYAVAKKEKIRCGYLQGLGATKDYEVAVYDLDEKQYYRTHCQVQSEITSLYGTISEVDGEPYFHVHMQAMKKDGQAVGGHLIRCLINATAEIVIQVLAGKAGRKLDKNTGLNVLEF